jgi:diaminohydroxyphosphoribosylaminopyrimidine deaminase / 5-amino-6-(5-phosphoribosylamino)uracil reductase
MPTSADHEFMASALRLAERGLLTTTPNPRVGCVIVAEGRVVGAGWHEWVGGPHAEVRALEAAGNQARGATAYVTLEPCSHFGRTPPCAEALITAGVRRVVAAMRDPNPEVAGRGLERLRAAGIEVVTGPLEAEARELNVGFVARMTRGRPWLRLKLAASLDGRTALSNGVSQWITGPDARRDVHRWRARACAILSGMGTVRADDPRLTVREVATPRQPAKIIVDSRLEITPAARVFEGGNVLVATAAADNERIARLRAAGAQVLQLPARGGRVDLHRLMLALADEGFNEVMVEAGSELNGSLLHAGLVDECVLYLAPKLLGHRARGMFALPELLNMNEHIELKIRDLRMVGPDLRIIARPLTPQG